MLEGKRVLRHVAYTEITVALSLVVNLLLWKAIPAIRYIGCFHGSAVGGDGGRGGIPDNRETVRGRNNLFTPTTLHCDCLWNSSPDYLPIHANPNAEVSLCKWANELLW